MPGAAGRNDGQRRSQGGGGRGAGGNAGPRASISQREDLAPRAPGGEVIHAGVWRTNDSRIFSMLLKGGLYSSSMYSWRLAHQKVTHRPSSECADTIAKN